MNNEVINRGDTSITEEDNISGVITETKLETKTIGYIFEERAKFFQNLLTFLEKYTYNASGYEEDKTLQDIDRRIVNSELFQPEIKYHVEPLKFWFFISSNHEERNLEQLNV